jgi:hypothetical protein
VCGMRQFSLMMMLAVSLVGCGDKWDKAASKMEDFKTKTCACKDKACVEGVKKDEKEWEATMKDTFKKDEKPPEKFMEKAEKLDKESRECRKTIEKTADADANAAMLKKMADYKDQMCACKDSACVAKVSGDFAKWSKDQAASPEPPAMDEAMQKPFTDLSEAMGKCMQTAMMGSAAPATP